MIETLIPICSCIACLIIGWCIGHKKGYRKGQLDTTYSFNLETFAQEYAQRLQQPQHFKSALDVMLPNPVKHPDCHNIALADAKKRCLDYLFEQIDAQGLFVPDAYELESNPISVFTPYRVELSVLVGKYPPKIPYSKPAILASVPPIVDQNKCQ